MADDIVERLRQACVGHPNARIPWPHYLLHDAAAEIESLRASRSSLVEQCARVAESRVGYWDNMANQYDEHVSSQRNVPLAHARAAEANQIAANIRAIPSPPSKGTDDEG